MATRKTQDGATITIKKYANRRLYNTATSAYVTLDDLRQLISEDVDFVVVDAKTGEDLTRAVLTQILAEAEQGGASLLPVGFLRQVISMYGDGMGWMLPQYLEFMTSWFERHQEETRKNMEGAFGGVFPVGASMDVMQEAARQNMATFEQAMRTFWPAPTFSTGAGTSDASDEDDGIAELRRKLAEMQDQLEALSDKKS